VPSPHGTVFQNGLSFFPCPKLRPFFRKAIGSPYMDLKAAIEIVEAIHGPVGLGDCEADQLAAWTDQSVKSICFRLRPYFADLRRFSARSASTS
jgi:hypothetical protein